MNAAKTSYRKVSGILPAAFLLSCTLAFCSVSPAPAQGDQTLRNPLIPGALSTEPMSAAPEGAPPPPGDGDTPAPVTPGHSGAPLPPPSAVPTEPTSALDRSQVDAAVAPFLTPPPSTRGDDPGMLPGTTSGYKPPASLTQVGAGGGLHGDAPVHKWGGQTTGEYGYRRVRGSQTTDFGQPLKTVAVVPPFQSEDGPRPVGANGAPLAPNFPGAQQTSCLHGNRILYKGNQRAVMTIAPY